MKTFKEFFEKRANLLSEEMFDSPFLFKEMALLNPSAISKITSAIDFVNENKINAMVIGGMAVSHYTADRSLTPDVDFMVPALGELKQLLTQKGVQWQPLASSGAYEGIQVPALDADFIDMSAGNVALNQYAMQTAVTALIGGHNVKIISPVALCLMKFSVGRAKDLEDAFKLLKVSNKNELKTALKALKNHLGDEIDAKTIWSYATML